MAPKVKFSREQVIAAALVIAGAEGVDSITIRKVAEELGSSIAPIYVNFATVDELKQAVVSHIFSLAQRMLAESEEQSFLGIGMASLRFAREYPVLFQDLVLRQSRHIAESEPAQDTILSMMRADSSMAGLDEGELAGLLLKMRIFTTGLSLMAAGMLAGELSEEAQRELLAETGNDLVAAAQLRQT